jgi:uncharacterized membrane protein YqaE (UPF0057 family)
MSITRVLICLFLPPLAVIDKGCGVVLLVCVLTIFGWIPGALAALIICVQQPPRPQPWPSQQQPSSLQPVRQQSYEAILGAAVFGAFLILGSGVYFSTHKSANESSVNVSPVKNPDSLSSSPPALATSPSSAPQALRPLATNESQREALRRFPELGIAGSKLNKEFLVRYRRYQHERPDFFRDTSWPVHLAEEVSKTVSSPQPTPERTAVAPPSRTGRTVTVGGYFASPSEELFDRAMNYADQRDEAALSKLMATGLVIPLKAGMPVEITDTKMFSGKLKIRPRGQKIELWTVVEAVKDK